jgi:NAD(P)-dependent dehydrogenase (short-subunit alcohol dehydrogenase family)
MDEEDWDRVVDINLKGTFVTSKAVLRGMIRRRGGVILNIGSLVSVRMLEAPLHYCASKAGLKGLTESMAKEVARYQIRVNCLAPGLLEGGLGRNLPEHRLADYLKHCALGRVGTFDEVARFAAFLVSDQNTYMSGATIVMDGGV